MTDTPLSELELITLEIKESLAAKGYLMDTAKLVLKDGRIIYDGVVMSEQLRQKIVDTSKYAGARRQKHQ